MKFEATANVTISVRAEIEADTQEEADEIAYALEVPGLCYSCARGQEGCWAVGELDGEPYDIQVEVVA